MRRKTVLGRAALALSALVAGLAITPPAAGQDAGRYITDDEVIAATRAATDSLVCPVVGGDAAEDSSVSDPARSDGTAVESVRVRCSYPRGRRAIEVEFRVRGRNPGPTICNPYLQPGRTGSEIDTGRLLDPLAITATINFTSSDTEASLAEFEAGALQLAQAVAPAAETCPTPPVLPYADDTVESALATVDAAVRTNCTALPADVAAGLEVIDLRPQAEVRAQRPLNIDNATHRGLEERIRIECRWGRTTATVTALTVGTDSFNADSWDVRSEFECTAPSQARAPAGIGVEILGDDPVISAIQPRVDALVDALVPLAIDCDVENAEAAAIVADRGDPSLMQTTEVVCPAFDGLEPDSFAQFDASGQMVAQLIPTFPRVYPGIDGRCQWARVEPTENGGTTSTRLTLQLYVMPPRQGMGDTAKTCGATAIEPTDGAFARIDSASRAAFVDVLVEPADDGILNHGIELAQRFVTAQEGLAADCTGLPDLSFDALVTPLPTYLAGALEAGADGRFAVAALDSADPPAAVEADETALDPATTPAAAAPSGSGGDPWYAWPLRIARLVMLVISLLALAVAFIFIRRPSRIRPVMEGVRIACTLGGALLMFVVLSVGTPAWAVAGALVAGGLLGLLQGQNLVVTLQEKGLYAQRSGLAIVAFGAGLVLTQIAGLLNRTGAITLGLALSFLSAALTVGVIIGRRDAVTAARAGSIASALLIGAIVVGPLTAPPSQAQEQEPEIDPGIEALNGAVGWDDVTMIAGLTLEPVAVPITPGLTEAPAPITRELTDAWTGSLQETVSGTETFTFALGADGLCCEISYAADLTRADADFTGWVNYSTISLTESLIGSVRAYGAQNFFGPDPLTFGDTTDLFGECGRPVSERTDDVTIDNPTGLINDEERNISTRNPELYAPCELDISIADAPAITGPPQPITPDQREIFGRDCPVNQEVIDALSAASAFEGVNTSTMIKRFESPNAPACDNFNLAFGNEAPGGTRNELTYYLKTGSDGGQAEFNRLSDEYINFLPRNEQVDVVCDVDAAGLPIDTTGEECEYTSFHTLGDDGKVTIHTDYETADGPNVYVRAVFPTGVYRYRCHHCEPGDPRIADFVQSATALAQLGPDSNASPSGLSDAAEAAADPDREAGETSNDDGLSNEDAAWAGLAGLLAALGISITTLIEAGVRPGDILSQLSERERRAATGEEQLPTEIAGHDGEMLPVGPDGYVEFWDNELQDFRREPAAAADRILTIQRGDHEIFDHILGETVYLGSEDEVEAYAQRMNDAISADVRARADASWDERRDAWIQRQNDAMRADRQLIEDFENARARHVQRVNDGLAAISDSEVMAQIVSARGGGTFQDLEEIYYDWLHEQMGEARAELADAQHDAAVARAGELTFRAVGAAARTGLTVAGGPLGIGYTAAGLAVISGTEEGYQAYMDGREVGEIAARTGFGVVLGVRDAFTGRLGQTPLMHPAGTAWVSATGDAMEAYARGRMDGQTHEQATQAAGIAYGSSVTGEVVGAGFDLMPPGMLREAGQMGSTMLIGGATAAAGGGDFTDGALDAAAGFLGGRASSTTTDALAQRSIDLDPDQNVRNQLQANGTASSRVIPLEEQGASIQAAAAERHTIEPPARARTTIGPDGELQTTYERPLGNRTIEVANPRTVLEGLASTTDSRTGKQAPRDIQEVVINTRSELVYAEPDRRTIEVAMQNEAVQAMVRPGDELVMHTFSTPGKPPSLGADRDARLVISRPDPNSPTGRQLIEVPLEHYERTAYTEFARTARDLYDGDVPAHIQAAADARVPRIQAEIAAHRAAHPDAPEWTPQQIADRALSEAHNQVFVDGRHVEASVANTDQGTAFRSVANNRTVDDMLPALREQGLVRDGDVVNMVDSAAGPRMVVTSVTGDDLDVPSSLWSDQLAANQQRYGDEVEAVPVNTVPEALAAQRAQAQLSDPNDYARMWDTKGRFYAGLNEPEAVAQSQKGIGQLIAIRDGYAQQGLSVPPISAQDQRAIEIILAANVGVGAAPDGTVEAQLQTVYGPGTTLESALGRVAMLHTNLNEAYVDPDPPRPATISSGSLIRGAVASGTRLYEDEEG